jgi:hypothetical protein
LFWISEGSSVISRERKERRCDEKCAEQILQREEGGREGRRERQGAVVR